MITVTIDSNQYEYPETITILEAANRQGITIPTLCHNKHLKPYGGCRVCLVELGNKKLVPSCSSMISNGLEISTKSEKVLKSRRFVLALLLSRSPNAVELREIAKENGVDPENDESLDVVGTYLFKRAPKRFETNCILCGCCVRVCAEVTERHALSFGDRGSRRIVRSPFEDVADTCIGCGSCAYVCPTNTITVEEA